MQVPHRRRNRTGRQSARLAAVGREDTARSERLTAVCMAAWHARRGGRWPFADALDGDDVSAVPAALLDDLDDLASRWHALDVGQALTLTCPADLTPPPGGSARGRRPSRDRGMAARRR
jgi:hypothetical protein